MPFSDHGTVSDGADYGDPLTLRWEPDAYVSEMVAPGEHIAARSRENSRDSGVGSITAGLHRGISGESVEMPVPVPVGRLRLGRRIHRLSYKIATMRGGGGDESRLGLESLGGDESRQGLESLR